MHQPNTYLTILNEQGVSILFQEHALIFFRQDHFVETYEDKIFYE